MSNETYPQTNVYPNPETLSNAAQAVPASAAETVFGNAAGSVSNSGAETVSGNAAGTVPAPLPTQTFYKTEKIRQIVTSFLPFGIMSFVYGVFFCFCLYRNVNGITSPLLCAGTLAFYLYSFRTLGVSCPTPKKLFYCISICLLGLSNMLTNSAPLISLNYLGMILLLFCFLLQHFYETRKWDFAKYLASLLQTMLCCIGNLGYPFKSLHLYLKRRENSKSRKFYYIFLGVLISIPLLAVVGSLLLSADAVFRDFSDRLFSDLLENIKFNNLLLMAVLVFFGILMSYCVLIELASASINDRVKDKRTMEPIIAITFTSILTVVYLLFSVIQIMYLFLGSMQLPEGYTYAEYAREGFFQLLFVCLINLWLVLFCMKHYRDNKILKGILTVICGCTYIMIASSALRMLLYISYYKLTFLRVFVLVALFVLFVCLTGIVISIYKETFPLFSFMLVVVTATYIVFSLSRPDGLIASYNIANAGTGIDDEYLCALSLDAVPVLADAGFFEDAQIQTELLDDKEQRLERGSGYYYYYNKSVYATHILIEYERMSVRTFNLSTYRAAKAVVACAEGLNK